MSSFLKRWACVSKINNPKTNRFLRRAAAEDLGRDDINALIGLLSMQETNSTEVIMEALGELGAVEPLINALKNGDKTVRAKAAWGLHRANDKRAVAPLILALEDTDESVRKGAIAALSRLKDAAAVDPLINVLENDDRHVRMDAAEALGWLGDPRAVEPLIKALKYRTDYRVRKNAAEALGRLGDLRAVEPLIVALQEDSDIREEAAHALGLLGDVRALEPLIKACSDVADRVRRAAADAVKQIDNSRASETLQRDRREELAECLSKLNRWSGLSVDLLVVELMNEDKARKAFETLAIAAKQNASGRGVIVIWGNLMLDGARLVVTGIICPLWETDANIAWLGNVSVDGLRQKGLRRLMDQSPQQFGTADSPLAVYNFVNVQP